MAPALPAGEVTFLFTDVVGSTEHFASLGDAWAAVIDQHDALITAAVTAHAGVVVRIQGDSAFAAFSVAEDAVAAAVAIQRGLRDAEWPGDPLRVRIGLHRGEATPRRGDYVALVVHHASRFMAVAGPGQILCSDAVMDAVDREQLPAGCIDVDLGRYWLKDIHPAPRIWGLRIDEDAAGTTTPRAPTAAADIPRVRSSFHGRDDDLLRVEQAILDHPLTSIVGPGGAGKTRLALEAVGRAGQPGRVCFVDLTSLAPASG
ncbi:MAG: adenylate/guanylate cyclase domain-containing protein, partial [Actinomycetota bacterium]|nr:adenylate/guanylate cyclase domain-containing protein [Actinomycetota bacterium]